MWGEVPLTLMWTPWHVPKTLLVFAASSFFLLPSSFFLTATTEHNNLFRVSAPQLYSGGASMRFQKCPVVIGYLAARARW